MVPVMEAPINPGHPLNSECPKFSFYRKTPERKVFQLYIPQQRSQVLHQKKQVIGIGRAGSKIKVLIPGSGGITLGGDNHGPDTRDIRNIGTT